MSYLGLHAQQKEQLRNLMLLTSAISTLTVETFAEIAGMEVDEAVKVFNKNATDNLNASILKTAVSTGKLTEEHIKAATASLRQAQANRENATSMVGLGNSIESTLKSMFSTPIGWITTILTALPIIISGASKLYDMPDLFNCRSALLSQKCCIRLDSMV